VAAAAAAPAPAPLASTTPMAAPVPVAPPVRAPAPLLAAETTQQGLGIPLPALSTKPGFQAVTSPAPAPAPPPRVARNVLTDVTPALPDVALRAEGVPHLVPPQSPESVIVVPGAAGDAAPAPALSEQRPVAGEILSRSSTAKGMESALGASLATAGELGGPRLTAPGGGEGKRNTDMGLGPVQPMPRKADEKLPTMAAGEVVATAPKVEEAKPVVRKIILDPAIPEDDSAQGGKSRWVVIGGVVAGLALAGVLVAVAFKKTGKRHEETVASAEKAPAPAPVVEPMAPPAADAARAGVDERAADPKVARAERILDERLADPKVARALPTEFPTLLAGCRQAFTEKRAKDAEIACLAAKDANPESAEANAMLGHALFGRKNRREALQWAQRAVELDPKQAEAYVIIGGVKQAGDDKAGAKAAYKKYLELAPNGQYAPDLRAIVESP
jgi:Flp pilus assembly protein TadD